MERLISLGHENEKSTAKAINLNAPVDGDCKNAASCVSAGQPEIKEIPGKREITKPYNHSLCSPEIDVRPKRNEKNMKISEMKTYMNP